MSIKVEFGFYKGTDGQVLFNDISQDVIAISTNRGKDALQETFDAASCVVRLNNESRNYDPDFPTSPYQGQIVPTGSLRITIDEQRAFTGFITDWNFDYSPNGDSIAEIVAADAFWNLNNQTLIEYAPTEQLSSARVLDVLLRPEAGGSAVWPASARVISTGVATVGDYDVSDGTNILSYLQDVERAEPGRLFIDKLGRLVFRTRNNDLSAPSYEYVRNNVCTNPSFEDSLDGWTGTIIDAARTDLYIFSRITTPSTGIYIGSASLKAQNASCSTQFPTEPNTSYTVSFYAVRDTTDVSLGIEILNSSDSVVITQRSSITVGSTFTRISESFIATGATTTLKINSGFDNSVFLDAVLIEQTPILDAYFDGDNDPVYNTTDPDAPDYQPERAFESYVTEWIGV